MEKDYPDIYKGVLRARTPSNAAGTWELFDMCFISGYTFTLRAWANGIYVAREANYSGRFVAYERDYNDAYDNLLRARTAGERGPWEAFTYQAL